MMFGVIYEPTIAWFDVHDPNQVVSRHEFCFLFLELHLYRYWPTILQFHVPQLLCEVVRQLGLSLNLGMILRVVLVGVKGTKHVFLIFVVLI